MLASASLCDGREAEANVSLDSLIPEDHIIRKIDAAIDWQASSEALRASYSKERGRPAFEPEILLAVALLRHIYRLESLRATAAELETNLVYRWFIGCPLDEPVPHFSTISSNMLHRIPVSVFDEAFAKAICNIIDAGVMPADDLVYASPFLKEDGWYERLCDRYFLAVDQLSFPEPKAEAVRPASSAQIGFEL